ncbi:major facilitator superfamily [Stylosanthes scabra]|uniref:Major facilitator superfamily n=1 Tax=Stylosanthes scabra TaxID=79078 RepID=A0ABU6Y188_9FABA|nr:major facilitator superfamily [Stylosanthes scabra]
MKEITIVAAAATLGNLLIGWDSSTIAGGMGYIKREFKLDSSVEGMIVSTSFFTGTIVTIFSGKVSDMIGRRPMLIGSSIMFFLSGLAMLWAPNVAFIVFSRFLDGMGIALAVTITPVYISEIAPPDIRGLLNTLPQFSCSLGMFLAYIWMFSMSLLKNPSWRAMLGVVSIPSVAYFFLVVFYLPESPPWLVSQGRISEAKKVLQRIRGEEDVSGELALLAEGMNPGGESTIVEEYIITPAAGASEQVTNMESAKDCIKLYGPNHGVSMIALPISNVQGGGSILSLSRQGSVVGQQPTAVLKDPIVNLFGSMHEGDHHHDGSDTNDNLHAPLLPRQGSGVVDRSRFYKRSSSMRGSHSNLASQAETPKERSHTNLASLAGETTTKATNIGGGWQLAYKPVDGKKEGGMQRMYLHADPSIVGGSHPGSFVGNSGADLQLALERGESFQAAALVSHSVLAVNKDHIIKPEAVANKGTGWGALLEPGVKRALIVGIGLQALQQAAGINGFLYYAPQILEEAGVGALLSNFGISETSASLLVNVIITFSMLPCIALSMKLMDIAGRRSLLLNTIPILIVSLTLLVLRESFHMSSVVNAAVTATCVIVYESIFCMGFGVIPNIVCAEIFPTSVRGICISICALTFWISTLIVTSSFPFLLHQIGLTVPETKGMPLEVIIEFFAIGAKPGADHATMGS